MILISNSLGTAAAKRCFRMRASFKLLVAMSVLTYQEKSMWYYTFCINIHFCGEKKLITIPGWREETVMPTFCKRLCRAYAVMTCNIRLMRPACVHIHLNMSMIPTPSKTIPPLENNNYTNYLGKYDRGMCVCVRLRYLQSVACHSTTTPSHKLTLYSLELG